MMGPRAGIMKMSGLERAGGGWGGVGWGGLGWGEDEWF